MTLLQQKKLELFKRDLGLLTIDQSLQLALEADQFARDCGAFDPAYSTLVQQGRVFLDYAELLELEKNQLQAQGS